MDRNSKTHLHKAFKTWRKKIVKMNTLTSKIIPNNLRNSQAAAYFCARHSLLPALISPIPIRSDLSGNFIFADGSLLKRCLLSGEYAVSKIDILTLMALENTAFNQGKRDRLARKPMDPNFGREGKSMLKDEKAAYRSGWWSVPPWPKTKET